MMKKIDNLLLLVFQSLLLIFICLVAFENSIPNDWAFDDHLAIVNNKDTNPTTPYSNILKNDIWGKDLRAMDSHRSFRPLLILTFKTFRHFYGLDASSLRRYSIATHAIATISFHHLSRGILGNTHIAMGAAMLFASHPVHVEAVAAVVNIAESISSIWYIFSYFAFDTSNYLSNKSSTRSTMHLISSIAKTSLSLIVWLVFASIAILFKESALSICGIVIGKIIIESIHRHSTLNNGIVSNLFNSICTWRNIVWTAMSFVTVALYGLLRNILINGFSNSGLDLSSAYLSDSQLIRNAENPFAFLQGNEKIMSLMYLHFRYFYVLLWPAELCCEYSFNCIPKIAECVDPRFLLTCLFYGTLLSAGLFGIYKLGSSPISSSKHNRDTPQGSQSHADQVLDDIQQVEDALKQCEDQIRVKQEERQGLQSSQKELAERLKECEQQIINSEKCLTEFATSKDDLMKSLDQLRRKFSLNQSSAMDMLPTVVGSPVSLDELPLPKQSDMIEMWLAVSPTALLSSLMWMIIPFIPAAGVFLRLGTLLAERLLYLPSTGYCMLLSMAIFYAANILTRLIPDVSSSSFSSSSPQQIRKLLIAKSIYWVSIVSITVVFVLRARDYNPHWKNDATLFRAGVKTCPTSAKLQLQIAKLNVNNGNFTAAKTNIAIAKQIDPNFCDISFQEALVTLLGDGDSVRGMELAADSLKCIYTSHSALEMLQKVWVQQLEISPRNAAILELHGDTAVRGGLSAVAIRKYLAGSNLAFENRNFQKAIELSQKAVVATDDIMSENNTGADSQLEASFQSIYCNTYSVGGVMRYQVFESLQTADGKKLKKKGTIEKSLLREVSINRVKEMLHKSAKLECIPAATGSSSQQEDQTNFALLSVNTLSQVITKNFNRTNIKNVEEYAQFLDDLVQVLLVSRHKVREDSTSYFHVESAANSVTLWKQAGDFYLNRKKYDVALNRYSRSLQYDDASISHEIGFCSRYPAVRSEILKAWKREKPANIDATKGERLKSRKLCLSKATKNEPVQVDINGHPMDASITMAAAI